MWKTGILWVFCVSTRRAKGRREEEQLTAKRQCGDPLGGGGNGRYSQAKELQYPVTPACPGSDIWANKAQRNLSALTFPHKEKVFPLPGLPPSVWT